MVLVHTTCCYDSIDLKTMASDFAMQPYGIRRSPCTCDTTGAGAAILLSAMRHQMCP
eukprot:SAG31_NODE_33854_length_339_cov_0.862500_2_plen_56_part_01